MGKRHEAIGIKQVVRLEWYDYALDMLLSGQPSADIRTQLDAFISGRLQSGGYGERGVQTYTKAVAQIMKSWVTPSKDLVAFRDDALLYAKENENKYRQALHWAVTIAAYPFWHRVAHQVGRLLNLQDVITQNQIRTRCFESMGERTTIERSSRRVIRSFVAWGVLLDTDEKGCYKRAPSVKIADPKLAAILIEAALQADQSGKAELTSLLNSPAFFAFQLPVMASAMIARNNNRIEANRYGLDDEHLKLK